MLKNIFLKALESFFEVLAPRHCLVCREYIGTKPRRFEFICSRCTDRMPMAPSSDELLNRLIATTPADEVAISNAYALISLSEEFKYVEIIHGLKYKGFKRVGLEFGKELGIIIKSSSNEIYDAIVPIPIHGAKRRERGFNQSEWIAIGISNILEVAVRQDIVKRAVYTQTQTLLTSGERRQNVSNVFAPVNEKTNLFGKSILLVDDVLTTGSTLNSCANILMEMGAKLVDAAAIAAA